MNNSFYSPEELKTIGFRSVGENVLLSTKASIYSPKTISIGNNVRIDDFCILSGNISIGSFVHIGAYCALYGAHGITLSNFTGISARTTIYSAMDDFSGESLIGPVYPKSYTNVLGGEVILKQFVQIGAHCVVFPNVIIGEGSVIGACSMVRQSLDSWGIYWGTPATYRKARSKKVKTLARNLL